MRKTLLIYLLALCPLLSMAQERFVYLTTDDVQIDSILPNIGHTIPLPAGYSDSTYTVSLIYPEFIDMAPSDIRAYNRLSGAPLPEVPMPEQCIVFDRKQPALKIDVMPLAMRDGRHKWLVSFMLKIEAKAAKKSKSMRKTEEMPVYADNSVLAQGRWAKIRVSETGIHELTEDVIKRAGFTNINKVKIYGYGGNLQPETIRKTYLQQTDDLKEVEQCIIGGRHLFYAKGPVSWNSNQATTRTRNPYSDYGYYFITQTEDEILTADSADFVAKFYHTPEDYHTLYEQDGFAWYMGGRNLVDKEAIEPGQKREYKIACNPGATRATINVNITSVNSTTAEVSFNGQQTATLKMSTGTYDKAAAANRTVTLNDIGNEITVTVAAVTGSPVRLDYIAVGFDKPREDYRLSVQHPKAEYVHNITNQNLHADSFADMVIIIPTSQKLRPQAERLKTFHEEKDGMRVNIVPADELYNEFSSGTPDANAYRRYLKMLYDKAETPADQPKYLLLMGDCVWDNRMLTATTRNLNPDDYLLCFESENSYNEIYCFIDDGFFCLLDEGEGSKPQSSDLLDMAVGRFPVVTPEQAKVMVDKTISYVENKNAGAWQNTIMFLGDDGNENLHMDDINDTANEIAMLHPGYNIKKVMWDAYKIEKSSNGNTYPEVNKLLKAQQQAGALIFDYAGHGSETQISHEKVLHINDFKNFTNKNLPLWITASCDIMPFDSTDPTIGEEAVLNPNGGAFAFYGTTRTVYSNYNKRINLAFLRYLLETVDGKPTTLGEAQRKAKNFLITSGQDRTQNKLQYSLLGDPAVSLNLPQPGIIVDAINGKPVSDTEKEQLKAGAKVTVEGHVKDYDNFNGTVSIIVKDSEETITCKLNNTAKDEGASEAFVYTDRTKTIYNGTDSITDGKFKLTFAVPMDINYSNKSGLITLFAVNDKAQTAHSQSENIIIGGTETTGDSPAGPSLFCYLNSPAFINGGNVNPTPYFVAQINDEDGINTSGVGIGHDLMLVVDGELSKTYNLNEYFSYDFGSYTSGSTSFSLPELDEGPHTLQFRAWDIFNNASTTTLNFNVVKALEPRIMSVGLTQNPASTSTTFIVSHDRMGSSADITIEVFDTNGRLLWQHTDKDVADQGAYTLPWNLTDNNGRTLQSGLYIYRVNIKSDGSDITSKSKKLVIAR